MRRLAGHILRRRFAHTLAWVQTARPGRRFFSDVVCAPLFMPCAARARRLTGTYVCWKSPSLCARGSSANGISTAMGHLLWPLGPAVMSGVTFGSSFCHVCSVPPHPQHQNPLCLAPDWCPGLPTTSEVGGVRFPIGSAFGHIVYELLLTFEGALSTLEPCTHPALKEVEACFNACFNHPSCNKLQSMLQG